MTRMVPAHPLVRAEWPHIVEVPEYDFRVNLAECHIGVYVRRVSGEDWHMLAGLINHVVVAPDARRQGIGTKFVYETLHWLRRALVAVAVVHCDPDAEPFYDQFGFIAAPTFPTPSHNGPRVAMVYEIHRGWSDVPVEYVEPW